MSFEMQTKVYYTGAQVLKARVTWKSLKASIGYDGQPYRWEERHRAENMLEHCYPDLPSEQKRVIEVDKPVNIGNERAVTKYSCLQLFGWEQKEYR